MELDINCIEEGEVVNVEYYTVQKYEPYITLKVRGLLIKTFDPVAHEDFIVGKTYRFLLSMLTIKIKKTEEIDRHVSVDECHPGYFYYYTVIGKMLTIKENHREADGLCTNTKEGCIDCGFYLKVEVPADIDVKVGDYVQAEGRLDIYKADSF